MIILLIFKKGMGRSQGEMLGQRQSLISTINKIFLTSFQKGRKGKEKKVVSRKGIE